MLAVPPLRSSSSNDGSQEEESFQLGADDFSDLFSSGNFLEDINFDDLFIGIDDGDVLPDLEMDTEMLAEFSVSDGQKESSEVNASVSVGKQEEDKDSTGSGLVSSLNPGEEILSDESVAVNPSLKEYQKIGRKSKAQSKRSQGKRKVKVEWSPELHRRFVQAVEQLGVDKAVPSRILELMGIDCLTRHNIASHLQKYRSHRKHLLAREAETASLSQKRQLYGAVGALIGGRGGGRKREMSPWHAPPTMGFPPSTALQPFRPLHVWGHPTVDQSVMHMWPKHLVHSPSPPPWPIQPPPPPPALLTGSHFTNLFQLQMFLHQGLLAFHNHWQQGFPTPPVLRDIPSPTMYKVDQGIAIPPNGQPDSLPPFDHPSKESIDAAIGDVLSKPWLSLPLGLKPPSVESVMVELQSKGISKIPPHHHL